MIKLMNTPIFECGSVLHKGFEFDVIGNKIAAFVDPFILKVFPPLNYNFLDAIGSYEFKRVMIAKSRNVINPEVEYLNEISAL